MFCKNCGSQIDDNAIACPYCGVATDNFMANSGVAAYNSPAGVQQSGNGYAIAGFVLSFFSGLLGLIFSIIGLKKAKTVGRGKGLAVAGLVISILQYIVCIILVVELYLMLL